MFGLLRYRKQCNKGSAWKQWRLHYCGTCKTMGRTYGHASRMLLNHDTVYLAEVLSAIAPKTVEWDASFRSFNCFTLPEESPVALKLAAAATVALTEYKLRDHIDDSKRWRRLWTTAHRWWSPRFRRAIRELRSLQFDVEALDAALTRQSQAESTATSLDQLANPTATAVSLFFEHGATLVNRPDLSSQLKIFGHHLGALVYLLDAIEDQHKDQATGQFNALTALRVTRDQAIAELDKLSQLAIDVLKTIDLALAATFASRLRANLDPKLGRSIPQCCTTAAPTKEPWKQRWTKAWDSAEDLAEGRAWPVLAAVAASIFLFPDHAKSADSADECLSLTANLMALSSVVAVAIGTKRKRKAAAAAAAAATGTGAAAAASSSAGGGCCLGSCCDGCCAAEACTECGCEICGDCACDSCCEAGCCECGSCCEC
jgi:hypothetical protein